MEKLALFSNRLHPQQKHSSEAEPLLPSLPHQVKMTWKNRSDFFRRKPKTKEVAVVQSNLSQAVIPVDEPRPVARVKGKDELYQDILQMYKIEPTRWERGYPYVGLDAWCPGYRIDQEFSERLKFLLNNINIYAHASGISLPRALPKLDQMDPVRLCEYLDAYVEELFPVLKGVSLNTPSPYCNSFEDNEILQVVNNLFSDSHMDVGINVPLLEKPVFALFSGEGSLGPTTAILLHELQVREKVYRKFYKVKDLEDLERKLAENGLQLTRKNYTKIDQLRDCVSSQPAIVFVNSFKKPPHPFTDIPHCVILDEVTPQQTNRQYQVRIRDPYHKWTAIIYGEAFSRCWLSAEPVLTIQLMNHFQSVPGN